MSSLRLTAVPPLAKSPVPPPSLPRSHRTQGRGLATAPTGWFCGAGDVALALAEAGSSSPCRGDKGPFPPSAGFLCFPARFLRFTSCFELFRFLYPALLGLVFGVFFPFLLAYFILFLFLHVSFVWREDFCHRYSSCCKANSAGSIFSLLLGKVVSWDVHPV